MSGTTTAAEARPKSLAWEEQSPSDQLNLCLHKFDFPRYDGKSDPLPWLNRCEKFFRITQGVVCFIPHGRQRLAMVLPAGMRPWHTIVARVRCSRQ